MRLILTRHPTTKENKLAIVQGKEHGIIEEDGFKQIEGFIKRLKKEKIDRIISSDAKRCRVMTNEILKYIKVPVEFTGLIDEENYGIYIGKKHSEIGEYILEGNTPETKKYPGGESPLELRERAKKFLEYLLENYGNSNENILIISHAFFLSSFIGLILNLNMMDSRNKFWIDSCSLSIIEVDEKKEQKYKIKSLNETSFLGETNLLFLK